MSRKLDGLYRPFRLCVEKAIKHFTNAGHKVVVAETLRTKEYQAFLYYLTRDFQKALYYARLSGVQESVIRRLRQVRPGVHLTNTLRSYHLLGLAVDVYFVIAGRIINAERLYKEFYDYLSKCPLPYPLVWGWGGFFHFRDYGHYEGAIEDKKIRDELFKLLDEKGLGGVWRRLDELSAR